MLIVRLCRLAMPSAFLRVWHVIVRLAAVAAAAVRSVAAVWIVHCSIPLAIPAKFFAAFQSVAAALKIEFAKAGNSN